MPKQKHFYSHMYNNIVHSNEFGDLFLGQKLNGMKNEPKIYCSLSNEEIFCEKI